MRLLVAFLVVFSVLPVRAAKLNHQVLFISSYAYDKDSVPPQLTGINAALRDDAAVKYLFMGAHTQSNAESVLELRDKLDHWRMLSTFDAVILGGDEALEFALKYRETYFPGLPITFFGVNRAILAERAIQDPLVSGVAEFSTFRQTLALAEALYPAANRVVCIGDGSQSSRGMLGEFYALDTTFSRLRFESIDTSRLSCAALEEVMAGYGAETILIYAEMSRDGDQNIYSHYQAASFLSSLTDNPIFTVSGASLGNGFLGGYTVSHYDMAYAAAKNTLRFLNGDATPQEVGMVETPVSVQFDRRAMDRFGISKSMLPPGTQYLNDPLADAVRQYAPLLTVISLSLAILAALAGILLVDNRRRRALISQVKDRETQLKHLMDLVPGGVCSFRVIKEGVLEVLHFNAGFYQRLGFSRQEAESAALRSPLQSFHPDDLPIFWEKMRLCREAAADLQQTLRMRRQDGSYIWMSLRVAPVGDKDGVQTYYGIFSDINAMKEMQASLQESQHTLKTAISHAGMDYCIYDPVAHTLQIDSPNPRWPHLPQLVHNCPDILLGKGYFLPEDDAALGQAVSAIDGGAREATCQVRITGTDGNLQWRQIKMTSLYDGSGHRTKVICTSSDVTPHHREMERYKHQIQQIQAALPNALVAFQLNLTQNLCTQFGPCLYADLNANVDDTADSLFRNMAHRSISPEREAEFAAHINRQAFLTAFEHGTTLITYERCCRVGGVNRWVSVRADITCHPATGDVEALIYCFDIDAQKSMEQIMNMVLRHDYLMLLRINLVANTARVLSSQGGENFVHEMPRAEETFLGTIRLTYAGEDLDNMLRRLSFAEVRRQLEHSQEYVVYSDCRDGSNRVRRLRNSFTWLDRDSDTLCCTMSDVTDAFEEERRRNAALEAALAEAQRASHAKSEFLSRMSHEIRTPMNAILGLTQLAQQEGGDPALQKSLDQIQASGEYLLGLINDVLDMSRIESGRVELHPENTEVQAFFKTIQDIMLPRMKEKGIRFRMDTSEAYVPYIIIDRLRTQQIYINLLSNAVKFSEPGTEVLCKTSHKPCGKDRVTSTILFRDQGCGMSPEFLQRAFEPFEQEANGYQRQQAGTGLGLAIVKNLVEQTGGTISVKSTPGQGSEFTVTLTIPIGHPPEFHEPSFRADGISLQGYRILLVEDHPINTEIARKLLTREGLLVDHAANGQIAVDKYLAADTGYYDAILMDIRMPVMDGVEATKAIRASARSDAHAIPILAMTANAFEADRQETRAAGMNAHLSKPIRGEELIEALRQFLHPRS